MWYRDQGMLFCNNLLTQLDLSQGVSLGMEIYGCITTQGSQPILQQDDDEVGGIDDDDTDDDADDNYDADDDDDANDHVGGDE